MIGYAVIYWAALSRGLSDRTARACDALGGLLAAASGGAVGVDAGGQWVVGAGAIASLARTYCVCAGIDVADVTATVERVMHGDLSVIYDASPASGLASLAMHAVSGSAPRERDIARSLIAIADGLARRAALACGDDPELAAAALTDGLRLIVQGDGKPN